VTLTLASPKGGEPPIDPKSDLPDNHTPAMASSLLSALRQGDFGIISARLGGGYSGALSSMSGSG
jgi:hypothetical protein